MLTKTPRRFGYTLVEVMMAMTVTSIIVVTLGMVFITAIRLWYRSSAHMQSFPDAAIIMMRLNHELKCAANNSIIVSNTYDPTTKTRDLYVDGNGNRLCDTLTFDLPHQSNRDLNPNSGHHHTIELINDMPITAGKEIKYYPKLIAKTDTNHDGMQTDGEKWVYELHRQEKDLTNGRVISDRVIADNARIPTFYASGSVSGRVYAVYAAVITLVGQEGATLVESSFNSNIDIRNSAIPLTSE